MIVASCHVACIRLYHPNKTRQRRRSSVTSQKFIGSTPIARFHVRALAWVSHPEIAVPWRPNLLRGVGLRLLRKDFIGVVPGRRKAVASHRDRLFPQHQIAATEAKARVTSVKSKTLNRLYPAAVFTPFPGGDSVKTNVKAPPPRTHGGAVAARITAEQQLQRSVLACMLHEDTFYEEGVEVSKRIKEGVQQCSPEFVAELALKARTEFKLRHAPLWLAVAMCDYPEHRKQLGTLLPRICLRADEPAEFLAMYWKDGRRKIPNQVKKGLGEAMLMYSEYQLKKYR